MSIEDRSRLSDRRDGGPREQELPRRLSRREGLWHLGGGLGGLACATLLAEDQSDAQPAAKITARATSVIQIFCPGGMSQVDTFDHKPVLAARTGKPFDPDGKLQFFASKPGNCQGSFWSFRQHGASGQWVSDLFPRLGSMVDDLAFIYSMQSKSALHGPACFMMNTGNTLPGFPSMGAWVTYGLGRISDDLPAFVVLPDPAGLPPGGVINWGAGFLPAMYQATTLESRADRPPIEDLFPAASYQRSRRQELESLALLNQMNRDHQSTRSHQTELEARIEAYEMAARLQLSAPEVTRLEDETASTQTLYGLNDPVTAPFGRQCLMARRLVERGVRFVQLYCGAENTTAKAIRPNWDSHEDLPRDHGHWGRILDTGAAALLQDLKQRGMLQQTLVICTTEFGRQPAAQGERGVGRDHNAGAFTAWMAGGGVRGGVGYGATDELGFQAVESPTYCYDLHATALHLLGIDHTQLTFYHNGLQRRLTDVHGRLLRELLA